jgi:hypothetical protein
MEGMENARSLVATMKHGAHPADPEYDVDDNNDDVTQTTPAKKGETVVKVS